MIQPVRFEDDERRSAAGVKQANPSPRPWPRSPIVEMRPSRLGRL